MSRKQSCGWNRWLAGWLHRGHSQWLLIKSGSARAPSLDGFQRDEEEEDEEDEAEEEDKH